MSSLGFVSSARRSVPGAAAAVAGDPRRANPSDERHITVQVQDVPEPTACDRAVPLLTAALLVAAGITVGVWAAVNHVR